jgi:hypothetical protein
MALTPTADDLARLTRQNAMLMRALMRVKAERDALTKQIAALRPDAPHEQQAVER